MRTAPRAFTAPAGSDLANDPVVPDGYVRIPLDAPVTRVLAQVAALSQGRACTATGSTIAGYLGVSRQQVQEQLAALEVSGRITSLQVGRLRRRRLTDTARYADRFAIIPKRAIAGVGTDPRRGTTRRNGDMLLWLYCEIRRANTAGIGLTKPKLASLLGVPAATIPRLLRTLRTDGWITTDPDGGWTARTNPLAPVPDTPAVSTPEHPAADPVDAAVPVVAADPGGCSTATGGGAARRQEGVQHGDTDMELDRDVDKESSSLSAVRPLTVRTARARSRDAATPRGGAGNFSRSKTRPNSGRRRVPAPAAAASQAARDAVAALPRSYRHRAATWVLRRMAEHLDRTRTTHGIAPAAVANAATAYATHPDVLAALASDGGHLEALRTVVRLVGVDVLAGACCECGHHHDPRHVSPVCGCCARTITHTVTGEPPAEDPSAVAEVLAAFGVTDGVCAACDTTSNVMTRTEGLPQPIPVCDTCWETLVSDEEAA